MKLFNKIKVFSRAGASFVQGLLRPQNYKVIDSQKEQELIKRFQLEKSAPKKPAKWALYCYSGNHKGEVFLLSKHLETLGQNYKNSLVITPTNKDFGEYQLLLYPKLKIFSDQNRYFKVNGKEALCSELYDFDELEVFGNQFLVLNLFQNQRRLAL